MVRLVPIAPGLPGHSPALAMARLPHSANGAAQRDTILASPEPIIQPLLKSPAHIARSRAPRHEQTFGFHMILGEAQ
jgi:hypothetical protein